MTRLLAIATALVVLLMTAQVNRAEAKGGGAHVLAAGPSGVFAATGDGLVHRIDPRRDRVAVSARVGGFPVALAPTPDTLWAVVAPPNRWPRVSRLAPDDLVARAQDVAGVGRPSMVAVGIETVWLASWSGRRLRGLDASSGVLTRQIELPRGIAAIAIGGDRLWVALYGRRPDPRVGRRRGPGVILSLDAASGRRAAAPRPFAGRPWDLVADARGAWLRAGYRSLIGIELGRGTTRRLRFSSDIAALAIDQDAVWVQAQTRRTLVRVDRNDGRRRRVAASLDVFPSALVSSAGSLWAADLLTRSVLRIDPQSGQTLARIALPRRPTGVAQLSDG